MENQPTNLAAAGDALWATVLPSLAWPHRGGTLTVIAQQVSPEITPSLIPILRVAYDTLTLAELLSMTNDGLVGYRQVAAAWPGDQLVPDPRRPRCPGQPTGARTYYVPGSRPAWRYSTGSC